MNGIPFYLRSLSFDIQQQKNTVCFHIMCTCKSKEFTVYKNEYTEQEQTKIKKWEELLKKYNGGGYSDKVGNVFLRTKRIFGFCSYTKIDPAMIPEFYNSFKIKCIACGREYVIFDSRIHGYDALIQQKRKNPHADIATNFKPLKMRSNPDSVELIMKITNNLTYEELVEQIGESVTPDAYSNAFSSISIYAQSGQRKETIFSTETA